MMDYFEMRRKIVQFINESGISSYDLCRIGKDLCCCRTCKFFVQHYGKSGNEVDFGHCVRTNVIKGKRPHDHSCGYWTLDDGGTETDILTAPTVDAVEVVRCKDCKHYVLHALACRHENFNGIINMNGFCSYGERKDNGKE